MPNANRTETLTELLGVSGESIRWSHGLAFFIALLASDFIASLLQPLIHNDITMLEMRFYYWLQLATYNLVVTACVLVAFRYLRRAGAAAALAAVGYAAIMYPVLLMLQELTHLRFIPTYSPLFMLWSWFSWVFPFVIGLVLALRWLRPVWLALGVGAAVGGWVSQVGRTITWLLAPPDRSNPFSISFSSVLMPALSSLLGAAAFAFFFWTGLEMARAPKGRVSKPFFLGSIGLGILLIAVCVLVALTKHVSTAAGAIALVVLVLALLVYLGAVWLILYYRMWAVIQDGHARTTPGKAVGLLFIPFFNYYWFFVVLPGFAKDYNRYVERHALDVPKLPPSLFSTYAILVLITAHAMLWPLVGGVFLFITFFVGMVVVAKVCDAVNALPAVAPARGVTAPGVAA